MSILKAPPLMLSLILSSNYSSVIALEDKDNGVGGITPNRSILFEKVYGDLDMEVKSESYCEDKYKMHQVFLSIYISIQLFEICAYLLAFITCINPKG